MSLPPLTQKVLYEDNHVLAVYKPAGWLSQGDNTGDPTIVDPFKAYIKEKYHKPGAVFLSPAHRLDRPVSGCLILGRTSKGLSRLAQAFKAQKVQKTYFAITDRIPEVPQGTLTHFLYKEKSRNVTQAYTQAKRGAKEARLKYRLMGHMEEYYLLEVQPITGRSHQIRAQLKALGCPIIGDKKYGSQTSYQDGAIGLHCYSMSFPHPTLKENKRVSCSPPSDKYWDMWRGIMS